MNKKTYTICVLHRIPVKEVTITYKSIHVRRRSINKCFSSEFTFTFIHILTDGLDFLPIVLVLASVNIQIQDHGYFATLSCYRNIASYDMELLGPFDHTKMCMKCDSLKKTYHPKGFPIKSS